MEQASAEENRTAYDDFLGRLDKSMREAPRTRVIPSEVDKLQEATEDAKPRAPSRQHRPLPPASN